MIPPAAPSAACAGGSAPAAFAWRRLARAGLFGLAAAFYGLSGAQAQDALPAPTDDPQEIVTPRGFTVWLKYEPSQPAVALNAQFRGGGLADAPGKPGASFLIGGLLEEGAGAYDAQSFQDARDELGARLLYVTQSEALSITLWTPSETLEAAMDLIRISLAEPRFDAEGLTLVRNQSAALMRYQNADPQNLAETAFLAEFFPNDPYGQDYRGQEADYASLTREDLLEVMPRLADRDRLIVSAVGDVTPDRIAELVDATFGDLPAGAAPPMKAVEPARAPGVLHRFIDTPQSTIFFGHAGIDNDDPEYEAVRVMMHILAGYGANSRLTSELRDKRGLTYGVSAGLKNYDRAGLISGQVAVANERVQEAVDIIRSEWARMAAEGPTEAELDRAKRYLIGSFGLNLSSNMGLSEFLIRSRGQDLGIDYIRTRNVAIAAVDLDDVRRAAARALKPEDLLFSIAGGGEAPK